MAIEGFSFSFLGFGLIASLLVLISNTTFVDSTDVIDNDLLVIDKLDTMTDAFTTLESKLLFLNESIGEIIREDIKVSFKKKSPPAKLKALKRKLVSARCEDTDIIPLKWDEINITCLLPTEFCELSISTLNSNNLNDVDEKLRPFLICFMEPLKRGINKNYPSVKQISKADKQKARKTLLEAKKNNMSNQDINEMKMFLDDLPMNIILYSDVLIKNDSKTNSNQTNIQIRKKASKVKDLELKLLKEILNNQNATTLPNITFFNKVPFQRILKMPSKILCSMLPDLQILNLTEVKKIIVYKKCHEVLRNITATMPQKLGKMISLLRENDIKNLKNYQLLTLASVICQHEDVMSSRVEKLLAKKIVQEKLFEMKKEKKTKFLWKISCLLKYTNTSDLKKLNLPIEKKIHLCKLIGASDLRKIPEEEARHLTKYCIKLVLKKKIELSELGNLLNYIILNDIRNVTANQLLSWASVLQFYIHNDEEMNFTGKKLFNIYKNKLPMMTEDDLKKVGLFVETWNHVDRKAIPKESWSNSFDSMITTCQKMDNENNLNFNLCYNMIPFLLKTRSQVEYESKHTTSRTKRETRPDTQAAPLNCKNITHINTLVKTFTLDQIQSITKEEVKKCIQIFAPINNFTSKQVQSLMEQLNRSLGDVKNWSAGNITHLGSLVTGISTDALKQLNFSSEEVVRQLGKLNFQPSQLNILFESWLRTAMSGNISNITLYHIHLLGKLACGIDERSLAKLSPKLVIEAIEAIGEVEFCSIQQQRMWLNNIVTSAEKTLTQWSPEFLTSLGPMIRLLNKTTIQNLTLSQLQNVSSDLISQIPVIQSAVMMEKILPELIKTIQYSVNVSEVRMLVAILCDIKHMANNLTSARTIKAAVQLITESGLKCNSKNRDALLRSLLNSSSESLTDIFKRITKSISVFIEKPQISILRNLTREQIGGAIDAVFQKLPTTSMDALFIKWFKDLKIRNNSKVVPLDHEMLGFLACGLGLELDETEKIDENFIWKALDSLEKDFYCPAQKQKQWLKRTFNFTSNMIQMLAKNNSIEIDVFKRIIKQITPLNLTTIRSFVKNLLEKEVFFQKNVMLKKLIMDVINDNKTYGGLPVILELTKILCHINTTDITKINERVLMNVFTSKQKECTPKDQKEWLSAIINSTMHAVIELNNRELNSLMQKLESLLMPGMSNIPLSQIEDLIRMVSTIVMNVSRGPEAKILQEIVICVQQIDKSKLSSLNTVENLKMHIEQCIKPINDLEKFLNSSSITLADNLINYLLSLRPSLAQLNGNIFQMLKDWKIFETLSSIPLGDMSGTFEKWLKELELGNNTINLSPKHKLLRYLACDLQLDVNRVDISPRTIINSAGKFPHAESCSAEKQRSWLQKNSNISTGLMQNLANMLKNMIHFGGQNRDDRNHEDDKNDDKQNGNEDGDKKKGDEDDDKKKGDEDDDKKKGDEDGDKKKGDEDDDKQKGVEDGDKKKGDEDGDKKKGDEDDDKKKEDEDGDKHKGDKDENDDKKEENKGKPNGNKDDGRKPVSGTGTRRERYLVKADFPFSDEDMKKEVDNKFMEKLWNFKRAPISQKETLVLKLATKKAIKYLLKNENIMEEYRNKNKTQLLELASQVGKRNAFLKKTDIDEQFLSTVDSVKSETEAQFILEQAIINMQGKSKKELIKAIPKELMKQSGMMLVEKMYSKDTKNDLIQQFKPEQKSKKDTATVNEVKRKKKISLAQFGLVNKIMEDKPDANTMSLVLQSSLIAAISGKKFEGLPKNLMCNADIAVNELQADQILTMLKKCSSMVKEILKSNATKLGIMSTKVPKDMINDLNKEQLTKLTEQACLNENELDIDQEKVIFSAFEKLGTDVAKESNDISCTVKHAVKEIKKLDLKSQTENIKNLCKNLGRSMKDKITKESGKMYKDMCFKLTNENNLSFEELGSLTFFLNASDIQKLTNEQLLERAQLLSQRMQDKVVFQEISKRLRNIPDFSNPANLTSDDITLISIFIGGWTDLDKIPKESLEQAAMLLTEVIDIQMNLKKSCIENSGDVTKCSQLDPYLKNVIEVLTENPSKNRRKRRAITACTCELPTQLGSAAEMLTPDVLKQMLCEENFESCMETLNQITNWSKSHHIVFAEKAKSFYQSPTSTDWPQSTLKSRIAAIPGLTEVEIGSLNLSSLELAFALGSQNNWEISKLKATFDTFYKKLLDSDSNQITYLELQSFGNLLCGMSTTTIESLKSDEYLNAIRKVGETECFTNDQHKIWIQKVKKIFNDIKTWTTTAISSIGAVISGLPAEDLQKLTSTQIQAINLDTIPRIAPDTLKNLHPKQLSYLTTSQAMKITEAQKAKFNDEQTEIITRKVQMIDTDPEENNSKAGYKLNISTMILSIILIIFS